MHPSCHGQGPGAGRRFRIAMVAIALAGPLAVAGSRSASAQAPDAQVAAWRVECTGDGKTGAMVAQLPLGLNLTEPVTVRVNTGPPERQAIQTCTNVGCFLAMTINDKLLAAMRGGGDLKITMQDANKKPVEVGLPLLGFALAFDKAK